MKDHSKVIILILLSLLNIFISVDIDRVVITDISEDKLNNVLKEDNKLFIFAYSNSQQQEQLFTNLINEIGENIKASSGINKIPIYFINIINFESINFIIGDLNESNFNLCFYSNKQIMNYYSSSYSFDDISKWIFDKYTSEEKQIIFSSIKNQIELKSKEIIDKPDEKEEDGKEVKDPKEKTEVKEKKEKINYKDETPKAQMYAKTIPQIGKEARSFIRQLNSANDLKFLRIRTDNHEILISPDKDYYLCVVQNLEKDKH